ncbi:hypothetical protein BH10PSE18_BH10PSE18_19170 [soil metagenome]
MTTTLRRLPTVSPDAAALSPIAVPDVEMALFQNALIKNWWRADAGFDSTGWRCRKTDAKLVPSRTAMPTQVALTGIVASIAVTGAGIDYATAPVITIAPPPAGGVQATAVATVAGGAITGIKMTNQGRGYLAAPAVAIGGPGTGGAATATYSALGKYNGQQVIQFGTGLANGELYDGGLGLFPVNADFAVIAVGRPGPSNDSGYVWATGGNVATIGSGAAGVLFGGAATFDALTLTVNGYNAVNSGGGQTPASTYASPIIHIASFDDKGAAVGEGNQQASPGNYGATISTVNAAAHNTIAEFHVGGAGAYGGASPSLASVIEGGDIAELIIIPAAIHLAANAALLAQIRTYLGARYGIVTP